MKKIIVIIITVFLIILSGCGSNNSVNFVENEERIPVYAKKIEKSTVYETFLSIGEIEAEKSITVNTGEAGKVLKINFSSGDKVKKGEILFQLDNEDIKNSYLATESQLKTLRENLKIQYENLSKIYERNIKLYENGAISKAEFDNTVSSYEQIKKSYNDSVVSYNTRINTLRNDLEDRSVKSPIDGKVGIIYIEEEQEVNNQAAMEIINDSNMIVRTMLTGEMLNKIQIGNRALVYPNGNTTNTLHGKVESYNQVPDKSSGLYEVKLKLEKASDDIINGEYAEVEFIKDQREVLAVPKKSVVKVGSDYVVYVVKDDYVKEKIVELGITQGEMIEIIKGIKIGDMVVDRGQNYLKDGMKILLKK